MHTAKKIWICLVLLLIVCGTAASGNAAQDIRGHELVVYVAFHENEGKALLTAFQKATGVRYNFLRMPAGEIIARVQAEKKMPRADIILGGAAENHELLKSTGLLEQYTSQQAASIPAYYKDQDGYWTGFYIGPVAIGINKQLWDKEYAPKGLKMPEKFEDLLDPAFAGKITMPDPLTSGTGYTFIASVMQAMGDMKGEEYLHKLIEQIGQFSASGFMPAQLAGRGEYLICINFLHDQLLVKARGMPLVSIVPKGTGWEIGAVSMIKKAPHPEAAKAFIDFMLSKEAGSIHSSMTHRLSTRSDVAVPDGATPLSTMPINKKFSFEKAAAKRQSLISKWESWQ